MIAAPSHATAAFPWATTALMLAVLAACFAYVVVDAWRTGRKAPKR